MILKSHLKYFRKELNMTQKMLADLVGVRRETIIFLEKGIYNPSLKLAYKISIVLGKKIDEIFEYGVKSS
ncbi:MAG: helix-turn-helix transcriptional regulator [Nanoarchaeota archaeon]